MNTTRFPFDLAEVRALDLDPHSCTSLEILTNRSCYLSVCKYLTQVCGCNTSYRICSEYYNTDDENEAKKAGCRLALGLGNFKVDFDSETIHIIHATHGKPVGVEYSVECFHTLVLLVDGVGKEDVLKKFVDTASEWDTKADVKYVSVYSYKMDTGFWDTSILKRKRGMETLILPNALKTKLIKDVEGFISKETAQWYARHGIPYKRSYLLYGPPGTGKTSTIAALASHTNRNIAYLHITDPRMTDAKLKSALQNIPKDCFIVLEDVDALFSVDRSKLENMPLSFSGLLNALDGIGGKDATIFVLTTNHIDRLDPALIRPGRVDMHFQYPPIITDEQIQQMFVQFYPEADAALTSEFVERVGKFRSTHRNMSTATLQQYFIVHRESDAAEAVAAVEGGVPLPYIKPDLGSLLYM